MVKWSDSWLEKVDANNVKLKLWVIKKEIQYAKCSFCSSDIKFGKQGFQAFIQHSKRAHHQNISSIRFDTRNAQKQATLLPTTPVNNKQKQQVISITPTLQTQVTAAEGLWVFKVSEDDLSLRTCDDISTLFKRMFPDSNIANLITMSRSKISYILQDGLGSSLLLSWLCDNISKSTGCYTLMFDETTTKQNKKQMDLLIRYFDETEEKFVTKFLGCVMFCRATADDICNLFIKLHDDNIYDLPWGKLFNISADGQNIKKTIWRKFQELLQERNYKGLLDFISCTLHTMHNAFRKEISSHQLGEVVEQLAFDLHAWFNVTLV